MSALHNLKSFRERQHGQQCEGNLSTFVMNQWIQFTTLLSAVNQTYIVSGVCSECAKQDNAEPAGFHPNCVVSSAP